MTGHTLEQYILVVPKKQSASEEDVEITLSRYARLPPLGSSMALFVFGTTQVIP